MNYSPIQFILAQERFVCRNHGGCDVGPGMRIQRRSYAGDEKSPNPRRESAEERGLAAAARLAAAVAAATHGGDPKFRLRRHSAIGCETRVPLHAWKEPKEPKEIKESKVESKEVPDARRRETSPPRRLARAQSARRPQRLEAPARARSADPRRRYEAAFVPEGIEDGSWKGIQTKYEQLGINWFKWIIDI